MEAISLRILTATEVWCGMAEHSGSIMQSRDGDRPNDRRRGRAPANDNS
jgi:hypothetical protein